MKKEFDELRNLAGILKSHRKRKNITLRQLEKETGISNAYLSQLENGVIKSPSLRTVLKLSKFYGVSIDDVLQMDEVLETVSIICH